MTPMQHQVRMMAAYNHYANTRLYDAAARCDAPTLQADRGAFFTSILGVLNHLVVTDSMWLTRMADGISPQGTKLDAILHDDFAALRAVRTALDARIIAHVETLSEGDLNGPLTYRTSTGSPFTQTRADVLAHFFNHQTHHRGQAHHLLGLAVGQRETTVLDLLGYQRSLTRTVP